MTYGTDGRRLPSLILYLYYFLTMTTFLRRQSVHDGIVALVVGSVLLFAATQLVTLQTHAEQGSVSIQGAAAQLEASAKKVLAVERDIELARATVEAAAMHFKEAERLMVDGRARLAVNDFDGAFRLFQDAHFRATTAAALLRENGFIGSNTGNNGSGGGAVDLDTALHMTAETNRAVYRIGDPIEIVVRATNLSDVAMTLSFPSSCQVFYFIDDRRIAPDACTMALTKVKLAPKATKLWLYTYAASGELAPGEHRVRAQVVGYGTIDMTITVVR